MDWKKDRYILFSTTNCNRFAFHLANRIVWTDLLTQSIHSLVKDALLPSPLLLLLMMTPPLAAPTHPTLPPYHVLVEAQRSSGPANMSAARCCGAQPWHRAFRPRSTQLGLSRPCSQNDHTDLRQIRCAERCPNCSERQKLSGNRSQTEDIDC